MTAASYSVLAGGEPVAVVVGGQVTQECHGSFGKTWKKLRSRPWAPPEVRVYHIPGPLYSQERGAAVRRTPLSLMPSIRFAPGPALSAITDLCLPT
ncbi:MAG: hypothetical protein MZV63_33550 [Marinilabiliales bacterium]|nr:hypothetical protein [Marinilabiliales bacterium]